MKPSTTLILTATITPPAGVPDLLRVDPSVRLRDYLEAFEFYLSVPTKTLPRIVFAENSASDITPFRQMADRLGRGKEVFVTSHDGLDHAPSLGRAYGEMKLLDRIVDTYEPVSTLPDDALLWKGTGRYALKNIARLIETAPKSYDLYCDLKDRPRLWFDMRFFSFSVAGYRRLLRGRYLETLDDIDLGSTRETIGICELMLRHWIEPRLDDPAIVPRFRVEPFIEGIRGFDNHSYSKGKNLTKYWLRTVSRAVAPRLWI